MASEAVEARDSPDTGDDGTSDGSDIKQAQEQTLHGDRRIETSMATSTVKPAATVSRKKLPWLEGRPQGAGLAASQRSQVNGDLRSDTAFLGVGASDGKASIHPVGNDLSLRAIGSAPALRQSNVKAIPSTFSQSSQLPPGSKLSPMFVRRPQPGDVPKTAYASSEYSTTISDGDHHNATVSPDTPLDPPKGSRKPDVASHTRPKDPTAVPSITSNDRNPRSTTVMRGTKRPKPDKGSPKIYVDTTSSTRRKGQRKSCEDRVVPGKVRGARSENQRESFESSIYQPPASRPLPVKKSRLHKLPIHLIASSESSSPSEPRPLKTSPPKATFVKPNSRGSVRRPGPILSTAGRSHFNEDAGPPHRATNGLENPMGETLNAARDAARAGRPDEVTNLLSEATRALQQAEEVSNILGQPLVLSPAGSMRSSEIGQEDISPCASSHLSREASAETMPTVCTKSSRQPLLVRRTSNLALPSRAKSAGIGSCFHRGRRVSSPDESISNTPPRLYPAPSAESIIRDFAYGELPRKISARSELRARYGAAASFYGDHGESIVTQPGIRRSVALASKQLGQNSPTAYDNGYGYSALDDSIDPKQKPHNHNLRKVRAIPADAMRSPRSLPPTAVSPEAHDQDTAGGIHLAHHFDTRAFMQPAYYREGDDRTRQHQTNVPEPPYPIPEKANPKASVSTGHPALLVSRNLSLKHPRRGHVSIQGDQGFSLGRYHKRQPIAREWNVKRKRLTAMVACLNTIFIGLIAGIYAGEVPRIQYQLGDQSHWVIFGNMLFFAGLGLSTLVFWPLPLLHGRKPYVLLAFGIVLPLQIPQAVTVASISGPSRLAMIGLLFPRALTGFALGFANINFLPTLWDLYGASLMSERPHQEIVTYDDVRRQGGGIGVWLGIWTFCFSSSLSIGFCVGACVISRLQPCWGFYIILMLLAVFLLINVITPETRRAPYRRSVSHFFDEEDPEKIKRRVARGEVKLHIYNEGPKWWYEEVWAGLVLTKRMIFQSGFFVMMSYLGWIQAQLTLVILLLGALLSREYAWQSQWVGLAALAVPAGAIIAMPLTKASWLSRERTTPSRTDSMTFQPRFSMSTHSLRRIIFSLVLPFAGLAYCLVATGPPLHWFAVIIFTGLVGFLTDLGIAECVGIIMETFDTCDLQPGVNTKHRLQSMSDNAKRQRTNYSAFPRVCAGFFAAQSLGFFLAAATTVAAGRVTNTYGTQTAIWIVAAILLVVTLLLMVVMWRWKSVQVIPDFTGSRTDSKAPDPNSNDPEWRPVVIGAPSGKMRRMNILETGDWTRWTEIRKLNKLIRG